MISPDAPITQESEDKLGRTTFARALADAILAFNGEESFVIAIHGKWGTGKSSVLNLCVEQLGKLGTDESARVDVLRFNPWNFSDQNQLVLQFLRQFAAHLRKYDEKSKLKSLIENLEDYSAALSPPLEAVPYGKVISFGIRTGFSVASRKFGIGKDLESLFTTVSQQLRSLRRRTVVVIDDIDRLSPNEIRQLFQLVKLSARFPFVIYLLSFDREAVCAVLSEAGVLSGEDYLEKIVQVSFDLPPVSDATMSAIVLSAVQAVVKQYPPAYFDESRLASLYQAGFRRRFGSLRDVRRFINGLEFGFGMIAKEINGVDFIGVEALRIFHPRAYEAVRTRKELFAGHVDFILSEAGPEAFRKIVDAALSAAGAAGNDSVRDLLVELFPKLSYAYGTARFGHESETEWEKTYRVGTSRYFDFYFQLVVPAGEISVGEMSQTLASAGNTAALLKNLLGFKGSGRMKNAMESFRFRLGEVPRNDLPNVFAALIDLGDLVSQAGSPLFGQIPEYWYVRWAIFDVLDLLEPEGRTTVVERAFTNAEGVGTAVNVLQMIGDLQKKDIAKYPDFTTDVRQRLREGTVARIRSVAAGGDQLLQGDGLPTALWAWRNWGDEAETRQYVAQITSSPKRLLQFVNKYIYQSHRAGATERVVHQKNHLDIGEVSSLCDISHLLNQLTQIDGTALANEERDILEFARQQLDEFTKSGLTPEQFLSRKRIE